MTDLNTRLAQLQEEASSPQDEPFTLDPRVVSALAEVAQASEEFSRTGLDFLPVDEALARLDAAMRGNDEPA